MSGVGQPYPAWATIRDRCRVLGMPTWRADTAGSIVDEPVEPGLAGLWLRSGFVENLVAGMALGASAAGEPEMSEAFPGCWLLPIVEENRRRRTGITIAMALSPEALDAACLGESCRTAGLDERSLRLALRRMAVFDRGTAEHSLRMLRWMARDLISLADHEGAVSGFTGELGQSYETIDLLYSLGRSMLDLRYPEKFISQVCDRLYETMPFGWVAIRFVDDPELAGSMAGELATRGEVPGGRNAFEPAMAAVVGAVPADARGYLVPADAPLFGEAEGRVLAQPVIHGGKVAGVFMCGAKRGDDPQISSYDIQLLEAAAAFSGAFLENACLFQGQQAMLLGSLKALTAAIDAKDRYTYGHSERVALLGRQLALAAGLGEAQAERLHMCGLLHDVGKIGVPEAVLCKPGRLTDDEFAMIRLHPEIGYRILRDIPLLGDILPGVLHHHERWDGNGYPHRIAGEKIPMFARILALADTFDAMSSNRSYRPAMPREKVLAEIARNAGTQFDAGLAALFSGLDLGEYDRLMERHSREHQPVLAAA